MVFGARAAFVPGDDDGHLAEDIVRPLRELSERAAAHLLVVLREFAAQGCAAVTAQHLRHARECGGRAPGRFEEDERVRVGGQVLQVARGLPVLAWQEPLEGEAVGGQAGQGEGDERRGGAGQDGEGDARVDGGARQPETGVGDGGHARVGHEDDARSCAGGLDDARGFLGLVVVVQGDEATAQLDAQARGQGERASCVLGGDDVCALQGFDDSGRGVAHVTDGGGGQQDGSGFLTVGLACAPALLLRGRGLGTRRGSGRVGRGVHAGIVSLLSSARTARVR